MYHLCHYHTYNFINNLFLFLETRKFWDDIKILNAQNVVYDK